MQASEGESESSQGNNDEEERAASTAAPSATTSSGPNSFVSQNEGSAGGKNKKDREEEEEEDEEHEDEDEDDEGQGDDEEREEDEQPPPPQRTLGRKIQGRNPRGEGSLDRQLVCQIPKGCKPFYIVKFENLIQIYFLRPKVTPNECKPCFQNKNTVPCSCDTQWISKPFASHNSSQHCKSQKTNNTMSQTSLHSYG